MSLNLSIIIPAYNVQEWIGECLDSMKALSRDDFEVIVVNDGSTDKTKEIVQSYADSFRHFQILDQMNQGLSLARNNGLSIAKGMYVFFCDSDDYIDPKEFNEFLMKTLELDVDVSVGNGLNLFGNEIKGKMKKSDVISSLGILDGASFYLKANQVN